MNESYYNVENLYEFTKTLENAYWQKWPGTTVDDATTDVADPDGGYSATKVVYDGSGVPGDHRLRPARAVVTTPASGRQFRTSYWLRSETGTIPLRITTDFGDSKDITVTTSWQIFSVLTTSNGTDFKPVIVRHAAGENDPFTCYAWHPMAEEVTDQADHGTSEYLIIEGSPGQDITQQLRTLNDQASTEGKALWLSFKNAVISESVQMKACIHGPGSNLASFASRVNDGSATLEYKSGGGIQLSGFAVEGDNDNQNTVALKLGDTDIYPPQQTSIRRSAIRDIKLRKCAVGLEWSGWINHATDVLISWCGVGAKLRYQNASYLDIAYESNNQDFQLSDSAGVFIPVLLMEGGKEVHTAPSTMSNVKALTIGALYTELGYAELGQTGVETQPWLHIGAQHRCSNVNVTSAMLGYKERESVLIDDIDGFSMRVTSTGTTPSYRFTEKAINVDVKEYGG